MPTKDGTKWNLRYQVDPGNSFESPRTLLLEHSNIIPSHGLALDIAMGLGGNAHYLLLHGLHVIGVDISFVAVKKAKSKSPNLMAVVADMENFYIPPNTFDVIIIFLYLQRDLWLPITKGLKKDGVMLIECLTNEMLLIHPEINPAHLLKPAELHQSFLECDLGNYLEIIHYQEGWLSTETSHPRSVASLIARRIV
jgi:tellurite methyltransferase